MGAHPRWIKEGSVYSITQRTVDRMFLFLPSPVLRNIVGACAARALAGVLVVHRAGSRHRRSLHVRGPDRVAQSRWGEKEEDTGVVFEKHSSALHAVAWHDAFERRATTIVDSEAGSRPGAALSRNAGTAGADSNEQGEAGEARLSGSAEDEARKDGEAAVSRINC